MAKVQSDSVAAAMKAQNDSTIAAQATAAARSADSLRVIDSILATTKKTTTTTVIKKTGGKKGTTTTTKEETKVEEKPATIGKGKPAMGDNNKTEEKGSETIGKGKPKM
jgi:hypothetical protein